MIRILTLFSILAICGIVSCNTEKSKNSTKDFSALYDKIDKTIQPGNDFFMYSNGDWIKKHPIPSTESSFGVWNMVEDTVAEYLHNICKKAINTKFENNESNIAKIAVFYSTAMDSNGIEKANLNEIQPWINEILASKNANEIMQQIYKFQSYGLDPLFGIYVDQDSKNSDKYLMNLYQGGLGLPDRDYYFNKDAQSVKIREAYKKHIQQMFELLYGNSVKLKPVKVYELESFLASNSRKMQDLRDPYKNYNKTKVQDITIKYPELQLQEWFKNYGIQNSDSINLAQPEFFTAANLALKKFDMDIWKDYLIWNLLNNTASYLPKRFDEAHFGFYGKLLNGTNEQQPRWKRVMRNINTYLGEAIGEEFVKKHFNENAKKQTLEMVKNMLEVYKTRVKQLNWMSEATKEKAILKLDKLSLKIAYPDTWRNYDKYKITNQSYFNNIMNGKKHEADYMFGHLGKPVDRSQWHMNPQTYNAYYNPSNNEIVFPAAILMIPGSKDLQNDVAIQYGFIGATIGHEITHGLDDQGAKYDEKGNLNNWWTTEDEQKFNERAKIMINQYSEYTVPGGKKVNGEATLGENIADLGGTIIAYKAFENTDYAKDTTTINGFTPAQRFFLAYSYSWMQFPRDEYLQNQVMVDVHAPVMFRVNGTLANMPEFYKAFSISDKNLMYRNKDKQVQIW